MRPEADDILLQHFVSRTHAFRSPGTVPGPFERFRKAVQSSVGLFRHDLYIDLKPARSVIPGRPPGQVGHQLRRNIPLRPHAQDRRSTILFERRKLRIASGDMAEQRSNAAVFGRLRKQRQRRRQAVFSAAREQPAQRERPNQPSHIGFFARNIRVRHCSTMALPSRTCNRRAEGGPFAMVFDPAGRLRRRGRQYCVKVDTRGSKRWIQTHGDGQHTPVLDQDPPLARPWRAWPSCSLPG